MQVQEKYLHRVQKTHRHVAPHFLCPQVPKKIRPGPKNMCGSKKRKNMHPDLLRTSQAERKNAERVQSTEQRNKQH